MRCGLVRLLLAEEPLAHLGRLSLRKLRGASLLKALPLGLEEDLARLLVLVLEHELDSESEREGKGTQSRTPLFMIKEETLMKACPI